MRIFRAIRDFFSDLGEGDPVALIIGGVVLFLATLVAVIWIIDLRKRKGKNKKHADKGKTGPKVKSKT